MGTPQPHWLFLGVCHPKCKYSMLVLPRSLTSSASSLHHLLQLLIRGYLTPAAHFGMVWSLLGCSDRHSPSASSGDTGSVGMVRAW